MSETTGHWIDPTGDVGDSESERLRLAADHCGIGPDHFPASWKVHSVNTERRSILQMTERLRTKMSMLITRHRYGRLGRGTRIIRPEKIVGHRSIALGDRVTFWPHSRLTAANSEHGCEKLTVGDGTVVHPFANIAAVRSVEIGQDVLIASHCFITDHDHDWLDPFDPASLNRRLLSSPTKIGNRCWLGERVSVLKGATIGDGCVIGAHSVVTGTIPPFSVALGAPARVVRSWDHERRAWVLAT
jgi:lipopolysaccharide O-acetyltransferase